MCPSVGIRIGLMRAFHFTAGYLNNFPLVSGGGVYDAGFAFPVDSTGSSLFWVGLGALLYDALVLSAKGGVRISDHVAFTPGLHAAFNEGEEYGVAMGLPVTF